jgi:hypothetical protein
VRRAAVAVIPGPVVAASLGVFAAGALALSAPSEGMLDWSEVPQPVASHDGATVVAAPAQPRRGRRR